MKIYLRARVLCFHPWSWNTWGWLTCVIDRTTSLGKPRLPPLPPPPQNVLDLDIGPQHHSECSGTVRRRFQTVMQRIFNTPSYSLHFQIWHATSSVRFVSITKKIKNREEIVILTSCCFYILSKVDYCIFKLSSLLCLLFSSDHLLPTRCLIISFGTVR